jgi:hypothetical protein
MSRSPSIARPVIRRLFDSGVIRLFRLQASFRAKEGLMRLLDIPRPPSANRRSGAPANAPGMTTAPVSVSC